MGKKAKKPLSETRRIVTISVCAVVIGICIAALIVANFFLNTYSLIAHRFFAGDTIGANESNSVFEEADNVVRETAAESMVLLENKDGYLPITEKKVNLFGWGSTEYGFLLTGGGSGGTSITNDKDYKLDPDDAFKEEGFTINKTLYNAYTGFSKFDADYRGTDGTTNAYVAESLKNPGASFYSDSRMNQAKEFSDVAVAFISRWGAENVNMSGSDELRNVDKYKNGTFLELTAEEIAMFDALQANNFNVIVVLNVCNNIELGFVEDYSCIKACIHAGIPGQTGAVAIPQIISGKVNPSGRMSDTLPYDYQSNNPTYANAAKSNNNLVYQEGIYFGYKWYETADAEGFFDSVSNKYGTGYDGVVQYPFGHGLSYTDFEWTTDWSRVSKTLGKDGVYDVNVTVKNVGDTAGKDVVQLYGHTDYIDGGIEKPERTLLDFAKTKLLQPGEEDTVTLTFSTYDLASYDEYNKNKDAYTGYEVEKGEVLISVQRDAHDTTSANYASETFNVPAVIGYTEDPVSGNEVKNRFTGATAYADMPIDGSKVYTDEKAFEYLSRKNHFANFTGLRQLGTPTKTALADKAATYRHHDYDNKDTSAYKYGEHMGLHLVEAQSGSGDAAVVSRASLANLTGEEPTELAFSTYVMEALADYDDEETWDLFLNQLTQAEIKTLIGQGGFTTAALYSVGKPRCTDKDGPAGYNDNVTNPGKSSVYTLYPSESLTGCSFSKEIAYKIGEAQGKIGQEFGINGWYGPGVNLHRTVYTSRNYEYYSEDATLSGLLAAETIRGAKENHVYCYLKHMAVSEAGINPKDVNTWLTEQAFREAYLRPFEIAVKKGGANAMMSAFNRIGSVLSAYNKAMLTDVLRTEWGFKGSVITDWYTGQGYADNHTLGVLAGNDLWLCGSMAQDAKIDLGNNAVKYAARQSAKNILYTYVDTNLGNDSVKVNPEAESGLFIFLWTFINLIFGIGILICIWFILISIPPIRRHIPFLANKDKRRAEAYAAYIGESAPAAETDETATQIEAAPDATAEDSENAQTDVSSESDIAAPSEEQPTEEPVGQSAEREEPAENENADETPETPETAETEKTEELAESAEPSESADTAEAKEAEKPTAEKKPTAKKSSTAAKKPAATKSTAAKPSAKKPAAKKSATEKPTAKDQNE